MKVYISFAHSYTNKIRQSPPPRMQMSQYGTVLCIELVKDPKIIRLIDFDTVRIFCQGIRDPLISGLESNIIQPPRRDAQCIHEQFFKIECREKYVTPLLHIAHDLFGIFIVQIGVLIDRDQSYIILLGAVQTCYLFVKSIVKITISTMFTENIGQFLVKDKKTIRDFVPYI